MNRVLQYLGRSCPCCAAREYVSECVAVAQSIESVADGMFELIVPSPESIVRDGRRGLRLYVCWESDPIGLDGAAARVATELRTIADRLLLAADAVEGGAV